MKVYQRTIDYQKDGEVFNLIAFGDVHLGAANCNVREFEKMLRKHGRAKNTYLIDLGDSCDCIIPKDIKRRRESEIDPRFHGVEDIIDAEADYYCDIVEKHIDTDKFLGLLSGNHHDSPVKYHGTDPTKRIAKRLRVSNLGYSCFYRLLFKREGKGYQEIVIKAHHGYGGACRTEGANMTKFAQDVAHYEGTSIFLYGHTHDKFAKPLIRVKPILDKVHEVPIIIANTGTFLMTLSTNETPSYSEACGYPPRDIGYVIIEITTPTDESPFFGLRGIV